ncbi:hypothetical protein FNF29_07863 [Cafeteria roenbergensis]|uniref:Dynamin N-terminal domain-containing protein n=1 Tax=Cafeteria roenbergensis TaxID=33653 RepID=A0A5A8C110_CAFRO|nr:hypothetical protein FNF29_07863 [Cafeteria roenbergensis]|eukprot:KAA0146742.1 hypothetical protein FNF29_07863 [Cafeteria roenbergensis]
MSMFGSWFGGGGAKEDAAMVTNPTAEETEARVNELYAREIVPLNKRLKGPLGASSQDMLPRPCVFVLGNHSSGKSTFINHILGRRVQTTGVAPTDDGFTIVSSGTDDIEQDGTALVSDPDAGFASLRRFGHALVSHVKLKVRSGLSLRGVYVIDSPGMIDSPISTDQLASAAPSAQSHVIDALTRAKEAKLAAGQPTHADDVLLGRVGAYTAAGVNTNASPRDRGYDFPGVVRWFAERADVILLFFDPGKPGTTGETLAAMRTALSGMDQKVFFVLNKCDQVQSVHDFARAYGSLCWNLSKVIHRKDLPLVFTTCVPAEARDDGPEAATSPGDAREPAGSIAAAAGTMAELQENRLRVIDRVFSAPARRADNLVTRLDDAAALLVVHARVLRALHAEASQQRTSLLGAAVASAVLGLGGAGGAVFMMAAAGAVPAAVMGVGGLGVAAIASMQASRRAQAMQQRLLAAGGAGLDDVFRRVFAADLAEGNDDVAVRWTRVKPHVAQFVATSGVGALPDVSESQIATLERLLLEEVPRLRRQSGKAFRAMSAEMAILKAEAGIGTVGEALEALEGAAQGEGDADEADAARRA